MSTVLVFVAALSLACSVARMFDRERARRKRLDALKRLGVNPFKVRGL